MCFQGAQRAALGEKAVGSINGVSSMQVNPANKLAIID
jgi:hypothetical protein